MNIEIRNYREDDLGSLNALLNEVYGLEKKENNTYNTELVADYNNEIVGYLTINKLYDSVRNIKYCYINYVCVKEKYRGMGIATKLLNKVEEICKNENISYIELTSRSSRIEAQELYKKKGYEKKDTNVFRKVIL